MYAVDEDDDPTNPDVRAAFRDATCAQVEYQLAADDGTGASGQWD
ncbi:hypothetical protein [Streptomyces sp. 35G-GA-8]|nr:hypothetical protein [Streptomyces sp. 35G-GA-8]